jgi:hypothetical protein
MQNAELIHHVGRANISHLEKIYHIGKADISRTKYISLRSLGEADYSPLPATISVISWVIVP